jgi:di/tricarboxylate transporter
MSPAVLSSVIMLLALALFVSDRIRPDAVALIVLLLAWVTGLVSFEEALAGFGSPAVVIVAAVLVLGRAVELTGAAQAMTSWLVPNVRFFSVRIGGVMLMGALLSAFMNNIAALAITMPVAMTIAREHKLPPGAVLMPLAFATILGGITTLVGTPANLIISSVREDRLGAPFGMFDMTPAAGAVALIGLAYLTIVGWRLAPQRKGPEQDLPRQRVFVFELRLPIGAIQGRLKLPAVRRLLRAAGASLLAVVRNGARAALEPESSLRPSDRLLVMSRQPPWLVAPKAGFFSPLGPDHSGIVTAHVSVVFGSPLVGQPYAEIAARSGEQVEFVAAGPRAARLRGPLDDNLIQSGDQLYLRGSAEALARLVRSARLLEIDREAGPVLPGRSALIVVGLYALAVLMSALFAIPTTASFIAAALAVCLLRLIPADEAYRAIDLPVIVLLAAMIPVGREFNQAGGSDAIAGGLSAVLAGAPLFASLLVLVGVTVLLTIFLNNVATSIVMAQVGIEFALALAISPDAALIAVLIGCSCDFLTPIGHQNNLLVMRPGNYRFMDYPRVGAPLSLIVVVGSAWVLSAIYG